ncbi:c-type cytochrome [Candidatus Electronema sp. TJ]|uniref:c-type cytochrome n=1 Tax=Candidatus Electronema sp. TJ TaxID=3401573 RepID=UPI003AA944A6
MKVAMIGFAVAALLVSGTAFASEELAKKSNCTLCHQLDKKGMGPALKEIAAKYKSDAEGAKKIEGVIKNGSKAAWGENSVMAAQAQVSEADAQALAKWILSLAAEAAPAEKAAAPAEEKKPAAAEHKAKEHKEDKPAKK